MDPHWSTTFLLVRVGPHSRAGQKIFRHRPRAPTVATMRFFRSRELTFWVVVVAALGALLVFAATQGQRVLDGAPSNLPVAAPAPAASQARTQVESLLVLMPSGIAAGTNPANLTQFAQVVSAQALEGISLRQGEGAKDDDAMLRGFNRLRADVDRLSAAVNNPVSAVAARTQIGLDVDYLHLLVLGQPAPELPAVGLDPFTAPTLGGPTPTAPASPLAPTLAPRSSIAPTAPAAPQLGPGIATTIPTPTLPPAYTGTHQVPAPVTAPTQSSLPNPTFPQEK